MRTKATITEAVTANVRSLLADRKPLAVARATGLSVKTVYRYRNGERVPRADDLVVLAEYFHCDPAELLRLDGES